MELDEKAEEVLETLWIVTEESKRPATLEDARPAGDDTMKQLIEEGAVELAGSRIELTARGRALARSVVRRHRLAERLLVDVLGTGENLIHERACKFEHILDRGLDDSICTLLGHPRVCPHGKPIPSGDCCLKERTQGSRVVSSLSQLAPGESGAVAYIHTGDPERLQKLTAMGIFPGAPVTLTQDFPSYVFNVNRTQFAVDKDIADSIHVRLASSDTPADAKKPSRGRRWLVSGR